jgi:YD repeat-containing protein
MKKILMLLTFTLTSITFLISCEEENLISGGSNSSATTNSGPTSTTGNTNTGATKCYLKDVVETEGSNSYKSTFTYNTKNLLEKEDADGAISTYDYDANNRVTRLTMVDGTAKETFIYSYDSKGNITKVVYDATGTPYDILIKDYTFTSNANGQVTKVSANTPEGKVDFGFEYDAKINLKKMTITANGQTETLIENLTFDDKPNIYTNSGLSKVHIPLVLLGTLFGGNLSYYMNTNNILTDKGVSFFGLDVSTTTYKYEYGKDNLPTKQTYTTIIGTDKTSGSATFAYACK